MNYFLSIFYSILFLVAKKRNKLFQVDYRKNHKINLEISILSEALKMAEELSFWIIQRHSESAKKAYYLLFL